MRVLDVWLIVHVPACLCACICACVCVCACFPLRSGEAFVALSPSSDSVSGGMAVGWAFTAETQGPMGTITPASWLKARREKKGNREHRYC